jgi:4-amino-4-deoxy-L-arabinose transferase-like glycosyltransferase
MVINKKVILFFIPLILYISILSFMPLMEPDEARYSSISSFMNSSGDYVTPHLNRVVYLEKPPLCYWATALFFRIFGENEFSSRLFVALCTWGCILLVFKMGKYFHDEKTGLYSAAIFSTFLFPFAMGRINILDIPLTFFVCLATWSGYRYVSGGYRKRRWIYLLYIASALAFLAKGLIGVVFPFMIIVLWLLSYRKYREVLNLFSPVGIVLFLLLSLPWLILVQRANPDFFHFFFIQEHFLRYTTTMHHRNEPFWFFIPIVILGTLPWAAFLYKAMREKSPNMIRSLRAADRRFLLTWIFFILGFFSLSSSKLVPYIAPVFLPIAVLFGRLFSAYDTHPKMQTEKAGDKFLCHLPIILQSLLFILLLVVPPFIKRSRIEGGSVITNLENWWLLVAPLIIIQILIIFLPDIVRRRRQQGWFATIYILTSFFWALFIFPLSEFLTPYKSAYPVVQAIKTLLPKDQKLYQYKISLYGINFYNKIRTPIVDDFGEEGFGIAKLSVDEKKQYFLSSKEFYGLCSEKGDIYCITQYKDRLEELKKHIPHADILWSNNVYYILRLHC